MSSIKKFSLLIIIQILLTAFPASFTKAESIKVQALESSGEVPLNMVFTMIKDKKGFLWMGSWIGLVRYDGYKFKIFNNDPTDSNSISYNDVISIFEDHNNNLWIGTWGGGLNRLDTKTMKFTRFTHEYNNSNTISDNIIWTIAEDKSGKIWIGTNAGGLNSYDPLKKKFEHYNLNNANVRGLFTNHISRLLVDNNGNLWVGTDKGLFLYNPQKDFFNEITLQNDSTKNFPYITLLYQDNKNKIYIGTTKGLFKITNPVKSIEISQDEKLNNILKNKILTSILYDKDGKYWVGSNDGLFLLDKNKNLIKTYSDTTVNAHLLSNNIRSILQSDDGNIWAVCYQGGVDKFTNNEFINSFNDLSASISENTLSIFKDNERNIWAGSRNGILFNYSTTHHLLKKFYIGAKPGKTNNSIGIYGIDTDENKIVWLATNKGIKFFNSRTMKFENSYYKVPSEINSDFITTILHDNESRIFIGTYDNGIYILNKKDNTFSHLYLNKNKNENNSINFITLLFKSSRGDVWIGTYGGIVRYDVNTGKTLVYNHKDHDMNSISNNYILSIAEDQNHALWIGTAFGLNKFEPSANKFFHFYEKDGLINNVVTAITEDLKNNLWIGTYDGISLFVPNENKFSNFDKYDGLTSNLVSSSVIGDDGLIYFSSSKGINVVDPNKVPKSSYIPSTYITNVSAGSLQKKSNIDYSDGTIILDYNFNSINIEFASLDYTTPWKNLYKYTIEGSEKNWINLGNHHNVYISNLPPGTYSFKVKGSNGSEKWSTIPATLKIKVLPAFWMTWWFITGVFMLLAVSAFSIYNYQLKRKTSEVLKIEKLKLEELNKIREQTARDFHDELGHTLTRISLLSEVIKNNLNKSNSDIIPVVDSIIDNTKDLYTGTKEFIWSIDPKNNNLYSALLRLKDYGDQIFSLSHIEFNVCEIDDNLKKLKINLEWRRHFILIFKEAMNNALNYSKATFVNLDINIFDNKLNISLADDGIGFNPDKVQKGNGIRNMTYRAEKLGGKIAIIPNNGLGTKVMFTTNINIMEGQNVNS